MFKRISRRQRKQAEEDALGLDEHERQILGMQDTDSSESDSDSESGSSRSASDSEPADEADSNDFLGEFQSEALSAGDSGEGNSEDESPNSDAGSEGLPMTTKEALDSPIYVLSSNGLQACLVCPGKVLKQSEVVNMHLQSTAHIRRYKKFCEIAGSLDDLPDNPTDILQTLTKGTFQKRQEKDVSNRAKKRKQKLDAIGKRRQAQKEMTVKAKSKRDARRAKHAEENQKSLSPSSKRKSGVDRESGKNEETTNSADVHKNVKISEAASDTASPTSLKTGATVGAKGNKKKRKAAGMRSEDGSVLARGDPIPDESESPSHGPHRKKKRKFEIDSQHLHPNKSGSAARKQQSSIDDKHVHFSTRSHITKSTSSSLNAAKSGGILVNKKPVRYFDERHGADDAGRQMKDNTEGNRKSMAVKGAASRNRSQLGNVLHSASGAGLRIFE